MTTKQAGRTPRPAALAARLNRHRLLRAVGAAAGRGAAAYLPRNPAVRFHNGQRGYGLNTLTAESWRADYRVAPVASRSGGTVTTRAAFVVESGRPGAQPA